jgi:hypothetical protein
MQISAIGSVSGAPQSLPLQPAQGAPANPTLGFGKLMEEMVGKVHELQSNGAREVGSEQHKSDQSDQ